MVQDLLCLCPIPWGPGGSRSWLCLGCLRKLHFLTQPSLECTLHPSGAQGPHAHYQTRAVTFSQPIPPQGPPNGRGFWPVWKIDGLQLTGVLVPHLPRWLRGVWRLGEDMKNPHLEPGVHGTRRRELLQVNVVSLAYVTIPLGPHRTYTNNNLE